MRAMIVCSVAGISLAGVLALWPVSDPDGASTLEFAEPERPAVPSGDWSERLFGRMAASTRAAPTARSADTQALEGFALIGTIEADQGDWALLERAGHRQTLAVGAELEGFTLIELTPERAVFERNGDRVTVERRL